MNRLFPSPEDFELVISELQIPTPGSQIDSLPAAKRSSILSGIREALCEYFDALRVEPAPFYWRFAEQVALPGDTVITFNYDVSLEAELCKTGKWRIGDGYGFLLGEAVTPASPITVLKLHGSTNWIDILFDGALGGDYQTVGPCGPLGPRPLILPHDFEFFGYPPETVDPRFRGGGSDRSGSMILPAPSKDFSGRKLFWDDLWAQASDALFEASEIAIVGYSLALADQRARDLLLQAGNRNALISICCGNDNPRIANQFTDVGFPSVKSSSYHFEDWLNAF